jgi:hypothetical protein
MPVYALLPETTSVDELRFAMNELEKSGVASFTDGPQEILPSAATREEVSRFRAETKGWVETALGHLQSIGLRPERFRKTLEEWNSLFQQPEGTVESLRSPQYIKVSDTCRFEEGGRSYWKISLYPRHPLNAKENLNRFDLEAKRCLGEQVRLLSFFHVAEHYSAVLREDLLRMGAFAVLGVTLACLAAVRSLAGGLKALIPLAVSAGFLLAVFPLWAGPINVVTIMAVPIVIAAAVDDGVYLVCHLGRNPGTPSDRALRHVGPALWGGAGTMVIGFGTLVSSVSPGLISMGYLVATSRLVALLATLALIPPISGLAFASPSLSAPNERSRALK